MMQRILSRRVLLKLFGHAPLLMAIPPLAAPDAPSAAAREWTATGHAVPELASFDQLMQQFMQERAIPGGSLAITRGSKLVLARGYTWRDNPDDLLVEPTSLFRIASLTKPLTATAILRLVEEQRLDLNARLTDLLPLRPPAGQTADPRLNSITVRRLLQHLGGWDRDTTFDPMVRRDFAIAEALDAPLPINKQQIATYMTGLPLQIDPGTAFKYSNYGFSLLGQMIEQVSGQSYERFIAEKILAPLNIGRVRLGHTQLSQRLPNEVRYHTQYSVPTVMDSSGTMVPGGYGLFNLENMDSHGGLLGSTVDLAKFATAFDDPAASPLLSQGSIEMMFGLPENIAPQSYTPGDVYYGCGWNARDWRNGRRDTWHTGGLPGTKAWLVRRGDGISWCVVFNQGDDPSGLSYNLIDGLLHSAVDAVTTWPTHDLFPEYLPTTIYLPRVGG